MSRPARTLEPGGIGSARSGLRTAGRFGPLVGFSPAMQTVYDLIGRVAPTDAAILITGETGTGKEVVANAIHLSSRRRQKPFVAVDCGAMAPSMIESELFGHERGSFSGADRLHRGYFERAHLGTLFLDEVTEMTPELQVRLLRVLETSSVWRIGGEEPIRIDVRIVAATNRVPEEAVAAGTLREDLFYRLNVFPIPLPPLRDRGDDVEHLAEHFLAHFNAAEGTAKRLTAAARGRLRGHSWPGNLRELKNVIHRGFILTEQDLHLEGLVGTRAAKASSPALTLPVGGPLADAERVLILAALEHFKGDRSKTAAALQVGLDILDARLNEYQ
jgi:DNA-binding NtrC family response regulator